MPSETIAGRLAAILAGFALLFGFALSADAKVPRFETVVEVDGTIVTVTASFDVTTEFGPPQLDSVVAVYPKSEIDRPGAVSDHSSRVDIVLTRVADGVYEGVVDLEEAGSWAAVAMPDWRVDPALEDHVVSYHGPVYFETGTGTVWGWLAGGAAMTLALGAALAWRPRVLWKPVLAAGSVVGLVIVWDRRARRHRSDLPMSGDCPVPTRIHRARAVARQVSPRWPRLVWHRGALDVLETGGEQQPRKSVWWSAKFPGGAIEKRPDLHVTWTRLDTDDEVVIDNQRRATNAHTTTEGWFMIAGIDPDSTTENSGESACWRVTAEYEGVTLSYVYEQS